MIGFSAAQRIVLLTFCLPALICASRSQESVPRSLMQESGKGLINLDVVVTGPSGKSVSGLQVNDFNLLDNGQPVKVLSYQAFEGSPGSPAEVILLIDMINQPGSLVSLDGCCKHSRISLEPLGPAYPCARHYFK